MGRFHPPPRTVATPPPRGICWSHVHPGSPAQAAPPHSVCATSAGIRRAVPRPVEQPGERSDSGGGSGAPSKYILNPDEEDRELPSKITLQLPPDSVISYRTPGGGGYGPVSERDPAAVLEDVINGKVSRARAEEVYGVVIDTEKRCVDLEATRKLGGRP